jgi:flagellar basal-body rod protein FlgF
VIRGLYSAAAGMLSASLQESAIANNVANVGTAGYLTERPVLVPFVSLFLDRLQGGEATPLGEISGGAAVGATVLSASPGPLRRAHTPLAAAIDGPGFFAVQTPQGIAYTRAGDFRVDAAGVLVTAAGQPVLSPARAPVRVPMVPGAAPTLGPLGEILVQGRPVGRVGVFQPPAGALTPGGGALYLLAAGAPPPPAAAVRLLPGWVEGSNVNLVTQLTDLLAVQQAYNSDQSAVLTANTTMGEAIDKVGTVS